MGDEAKGDAGGVLRGLEGDGEDDQGGAVVRSDSAWRMVRPLGLMPRPRLETAVASVGPRQAPMRRAAPALSPDEDADGG